MNWIYELSLQDRTERSKKLQRTKALLKDLMSKQDGSKNLFSEVANSLKTSADAQLGFLLIFERYLLPTLIETKAVDASLIEAVLKFALQLHSNLLRLGSQPKLKYSLKLFNKIISRLAQPDRETLSQSKLHFIVRDKISIGEEGCRPLELG
jgi:hypothetical protein